jgi:hypothetical protein
VVLNKAILRSKVRAHVGPVFGDQRIRQGNILVRTKGKVRAAESGRQSAKTGSVIPERSRRRGKMAPPHRIDHADGGVRTNSYSYPDVSRGIALRLDAVRFMDISAISR